MRKKILIALGVVLIATLIFIVCFFRGTTENGDKALTIMEEVILTEEEKELIAELQRLNNNLLNPQEQKEGNVENFTMSPEEPIMLKEFCKKIYEARKLMSDDGEILYFFDIEMEYGENSVRRIMTTKEGKLLYYTMIEEECKNFETTENKTEQTENGVTISLGTEFYKTFFSKITEAIEEKWEEAYRLENVNYNAILNKI